MRSKVSIFTIVTLSIMGLMRNVLAQTWEWQNPYPSGNRVYSMEFIDSLTIWFGSSAGSVWHSMDGGDTWEIQYTGISDLYCLTLDFISPSEGWLGGGEDYGDAYVLHTINGGYNWEVQLIDSNVHKFTSIHFLNDKYGWAGTESQAQIYYTQDGGETWNLSNWEPPMHSSSVGSIVFLDTLRGFAGGLGMYIIKSIDGGKSWENVDIGDQLARKAFFIDSLNGWLTVNGTLLRTDDGGKSWLNDLPVFTDLRLYDIFFTDTLNGWVTTKERGIYRTSDGGWNWEYLPSYNPRIDWGGMHFFTPYSGWIDFNRTWDGGLTLHPQKKGIIVTSFEAVDFINSQVGWVVSGNGVIAKTTDGGEDWFIQNNQYTTGFQDVFALDQNHIWAVGWTGRIYNTTNSGETWNINIYSMGTDSRHTGVTFVDSLTGWIVGGNSYVGGWILKTTDGGGTWNEITPYSMPRLFNLSFLNADTGFVASGGGTTSDVGAIYKTTDGGETWALKFQNSKGLESVCFVDKNAGWASGYKLLVKTTDSGENWEIIKESIPTSSCYFVDEYYGWTCGLVGYAFKTTDGGESWERIYVGTTETLKGLDFIDRETGWMVGNGATIMKTAPDSTGIVNLTPDCNKNRPEFYIQSNYPNPFNNATKIPLKIEVPSQVVATVFNVRGEEVMALLDDIVSPGSYELTWDVKNTKGGDLPSGIYICKIAIANSKLFTIKMLLLK